LPSPLDGLFIQTRDLGQQPISTGTHALGLYCHIPAALLFIQSAKPQIHLPMQLLIRMRHFLLAMRTLTMMHLCSWHNLFPSSLVLSLAYSTSSLLLSPACSLEWKLFFNDY
jgi:hypothetical protein